MPKPTVLPGQSLDIQHFRFRVLQDALMEATAAYWLRRAIALENAIPRPGDYRGRATSADLAAHTLELRGQALACRRHANLIAAGGIAPSDAVWDALETAVHD